MSLPRGAMDWSVVSLYLWHFLVKLNTHLPFGIRQCYFVSNIIISHARPIIASRYDVTSAVNMTLLYL